MDECVDECVDKCVNKLHLSMGDESHLRLRSISGAAYAKVACAAGGDRDVLPMT